ncbi:DMT family transporter [Mycobacterium nebraskense]|uniref:EamA domain-containing protein n=1 Tax=Mycobacterium nebraskense TaxID=244292 RepID=A0A1X1ZWI4_9MYCO|nr:DMT family transporter [Mycobacterium nebraskense]MBI2696116.1 DMT family transporter [Mycobacterium nebraskense]MCV7118083.1 DMT family transporter [Mycobacterium nebraskense]ORW28564.1 hypothetical protein AWC17_27080 [Mycobacterium nebraskense]
MYGRVRPLRMLVVALAWGSCFPLLKWGLRGQSVLWFVTWRAALTGLALLGVSLISRRRRAVQAPVFTVSAWGLISALAVLNVALAFAAMGASVTAMAPGIASVLGNAQALLVVLPAWWLFAERPRVLEVVGVAVGLGGLMLAAGPTGAGRGAWLALLSAAAVAAGAVLARRLAAVDVLAVGAGQFLIGAVFLAVAAVLVDGSPVRGWSVSSLVTVVTLAVVGTALPYVLWFTELRRASITAVTSWTLLVPVVGVAASVLAFHEALTARQWIGDAVTVAALALVAQSGRSGTDRLERWQQTGCEICPRA